VHGLAAALVLAAGIRSLVPVLALAELAEAHTDLIAGRSYSDHAVTAVVVGSTARRYVRMGSRYRAVGLAGRRIVCTEVEIGREVRLVLKVVGRRLEGRRERLDLGLEAGTSFDCRWANRSVLWLVPGAQSSVDARRELG
jgi:hypothetical protein